MAHKKQLRNICEILEIPCDEEKLATSKGRCGLFKLVCNKTIAMHLEQKKLEEAIASLTCEDALQTIDTVTGAYFAVLRQLELVYKEVGEMPEPPLNEAPQQKDGERTTMIAGDL